MRIYVAAASKEIERAERMIERLRAAGHTITVDWPAAIRAMAGVANEGLTQEQRKEAADADYRGVATAERIVILVPVQPIVTQGAWWEGGIADALRIPIISSGRFEDRQRNIFLVRTTEVDTDDEVLPLLEQADCCRDLAARIEGVQQNATLIEQTLAELFPTQEESERVYQRIEKSIENAPPWANGIYKVHLQGHTDVRKLPSSDPEEAAKTALFLMWTEDAAGRAQGKSKSDFQADGYVCIVTGPDDITRSVVVHADFAPQFTVKRVSPYNPANGLVL